MKKYMMVFAGVMAFAWGNVAIAHDDVRHAHGRHMHGPLHGYKSGACVMKGDMQGAMMREKEVDGFRVCFHVMKGNTPNGDNSLMVKIGRRDKALTNLIVNSKVTHPNGKSESKMMMLMGDWYMANYHLEHPGKHQIMVLFKTADGSTHFTGLYYTKSQGDHYERSN